jgi:hypothetical protein
VCLRARKCCVDIDIVYSEQWCVVQAFSALEEELTAYEIVAFRLKAESELLHEANTTNTTNNTAITASSNSNTDGTDAAVVKQTWGAWLLGRGAAKASKGADVALSETSSDAGDVDAARDEFMRAFAEDDTAATAGTSTTVTANDDSSRAQQDNNSSSSSGSSGSASSGFLLAANMSLNEVALTLISGDSPCLRVLWDTAVSGTLAQSGKTLATYLMFKSVL